MWIPLGAFSIGKTAYGQTTWVIVRRATASYNRLPLIAPTHACAISHHPRLVNLFLSLFSHIFHTHKFNFIEREKIWFFIAYTREALHDDNNFREFGILQRYFSFRFNTACVFVANAMNLNSPKALWSSLNANHLTWGRNKFSIFFISLLSLF